jgi:hypothetical protein
MKIHPVWTELFHADWRTDRHDEASNRFSQFYERAWNGLKHFLLCYSLYGITEWFKLLSSFFFEKKKLLIISTYTTLYLRHVTVYLSVAWEVVIYRALHFFQ